MNRNILLGLFFGCLSNFCYGKKEVNNAVPRKVVAEIYSVNNHLLIRGKNEAIDMMIPSYLIDHLTLKLGKHQKISSVSSDFMNSYVLEIAQKKTEKRLFSSDVYLVEWMKYGASVGNEIWDTSEEPEILITSCGFCEFSSTGKISLNKRIVNFIPHGSDEVWLMFVEDKIYKDIEKKLALIQYKPIQVNITGHLSLPWGFFAPTNDQGSRVAIVNKVIFP